MSATTTITTTSNGYRLTEEAPRPITGLESFEGYTFKPIREAEVNREMTYRYMNDMLEFAETDVVIVGAGR